MEETAVAKPDQRACVPCLLCGTFIELNDRESFSLLAGIVPVKVCRECKLAVAFAKEWMKNSK